MRRSIFSLFFRLAILLLMTSAAGILAFAKDRDPVIIIPGIMGSELVNKENRDEVVWFSVARSKTDDIRLPITSDPLASRDDLSAGDILRSIKLGLVPRIDIYKGLIDSLTSNGYHEEAWNSPSKDGGNAGIYVFAYDWRLDNVHNAKLLIQQVESVKLQLKEPDLKFDVIAHSMGGLIARYSAMYGIADLPPGNQKPVPTWAGDRHFRKIVLLGTPNEGSPLALEGFINGESFGPIAFNLPFVRNVSRFDVFTMPAIYELLPAPGTFTLMGEDLQQVDVDLYDPKVWTEYGWDPVSDPKFVKAFPTASERKAAPEFFAKMLQRAKRFHQALNAASGVSPKVEFDLVGAECKDTVAGAALLRSEKSGDWITRFSVPDQKKKDGDSRGTAALRAAIYAPGDGVVSTYSLQGNGRLNSMFASTKFFCDAHNRLAANADVQEYILGLLNGVDATSAKEEISK